MAKILALDYGTKRCGFAITDELQIIASGLTTIPTENILSFFEKFFQNENVNTLVIGLPKKLDNSLGEIELEIQQFIKNFNELYPHIHLVRVDERFTSKMAFQSMIDGGIKKKKRQNKAMIDEISATIILQSYLNSK